MGYASVLPPPPKEADVGKLSVVVVDDDELSATAMKKVVLALGHECVATTDPQHALALIDRAQADVVLSDSMMPHVDGLSLCRAVREHDDRYVYFVLVTAIDDKTHLADAMRAGVDEYLTKPIDVEALQARMLCAQRVVNVHRALRARNRQLRRDSERQFAVARIDPLTGARNRRALAEDLIALREEARRYGRTCAVAMCDLDHFKEYNDTFGHLAGDEALKAIVRTIERELRTGDSVYRFGGEEFVVLLPHQDLPGARVAMERVRAAVEQLNIKQPSGGNVTISVGISELRGDDEDEHASVRRADDSLYRAKLEGRNHVA